jgi:hypothetical protein
MPANTIKPRKPRKPRDVCVMECTGDDIFIAFNGVRIARRGYPDTAQAGTWVSHQPGWRVLDGPNDSIAIERNGVQVH